MLSASSKFKHGNRQLQLLLHVQSFLMVPYYGCTDRCDIRINHWYVLEPEVLQTNYTRLDPIQNGERTFVAEHRRKLHCTPVQFV